LSNYCERPISYESIGEVDSGAYQLIARLRRKHAISVGALGRVDFPPGTYIYTGRASKNLRSRLARHMGCDKKLRWHIDYFLQLGEIVDAVIYPNQAESECAINLESARAEGSVFVVPGFGSSDCRCPAHFLRVDKKMAEAFIERSLASADIGAKL
jgi:Uri superfamily endonuclease